MFDAVVLAGGGKPEPLTEQEQVSNKAFILVNGRPLLAYILDALQDAPSINKIVVVGPGEELRGLSEEGYGFEPVQERGSMLDNLAAGFEAVDRERLCLVVTGDIPLINASVIETFLGLCDPHDHDLYYPVLDRETCVRHFPETERTYVRLKEGRLTGGNVGLVNPAWYLENRARLEMFISYRKKPVKMIRILPLGLVLKFIFKQLSVRDLELYLSRLLKFRAKAVPCSLVELGLDVDKISDLAVVKEVLKG